MSAKLINIPNKCNSHTSSFDQNGINWNRETNCNCYLLFINEITIFYKNNLSTVFSSLCAPQLLRVLQFSYLLEEPPTLTDDVAKLFPRPKHGIRGPVYACRIVVETIIRNTINLDDWVGGMHSLSKGGWAYY